MAFSINPDEEFIARLVLHILCSEQRSLSLKEIHDELRNLSADGHINVHFISALEISRLNDILNCFPDNFTLIRISQHETDIKPQTKIEFCKLHCAKNGHCPGRPIVPCNGLHICKYFIFDTCTFESCKYGHDLRTEHNMQVRRDYLLDHLKGQELKYLLNLAESRSEITIPRICKFYNVKGGCHYQQHRKPCPNLHICRHYIMGKCSFGSRCKRNHNIFDPDMRYILTRYKINISRTPKEIIAELREALSKDENYSRSETNSVSHQRSRTGSSFASKWATSTPNLARQNLSFRSQPDSSDNDEDEGSSNYSKGASGVTRRKSPRTMSTSNLTMQNLSLWSQPVSSNNDSDNSYSSDGERASGSARRKSSRSGKGIEVDQRKKHLDRDLSVDSIQEQISACSTIYAPRKEAVSTPNLAMQKVSHWSQPDLSCNDSDESSPSDSEVVSGGARRKSSASGSHQSQSKIKNTPNTNHLSVNSALGTNICLFNLRGKCWYRDLCRNVHKNMPYQWQIQYQFDGMWEDLDEQDNLDVEFNFSNPECDDCFCEDREGRQVHVFFEKMEGKTSDRRKLKVRRLSTVSSEEENKPLTTRWHWFWQDKRGKWIEYGSKNKTGYQTNVDSSVIEKKYLENPKGQCQFETQGHEYILNFTTMFQQNMSTKTNCKVRRRPEHQASSQD